MPFGTIVHPLDLSSDWTQVDLQGDGKADGYVSSGYLADEAVPTSSTPAKSLSLPIILEPTSAIPTDGDLVPVLLERGSSTKGIAAARVEARAALSIYPHNGCAVHLSALLRQSGIHVPMTPGAGRLGWELQKRGWKPVKVGQQKPGDVGVTFDYKPPDGSDHVYLVIQVFDSDRMLIADNQNDGHDEPHERYASGHGKTATDYFLRAP